MSRYSANAKEGFRDLAVKTSTTEVFVKNGERFDQLSTRHIGNPFDYHKLLDNNHTLFPLDLKDGDGIKV